MQLEEHTVQVRSSMHNLSEIQAIEVFKRRTTQIGLTSHEGYHIPGNAYDLHTEVEISDHSYRMKCQR